ncbi:DEAD/DEAH box helicase [Microbacterium sp. SD291]|uniref:DEAD/DEAH box helicase n=1 Tax=Microbacterium sp. SD291 TaxID=2782007 RepID=UPI001A95B5CF|nr:DEAD/DEAH box helicase [Microbacterium sp. SD291]MBO0981612.1 DEAD/DEAH box helicase [Microbacterium sp. SD291]
MSPAGEPRRLSNYGEGADLLVALTEAIATARTRLWVKVPWWDASPVARRLLDAVLTAKRRGVDVKVLCRPESSNDAVARELRRAAVPVVAVRYIHEKEMLSDSVAITHSMNFTASEIARNQNSGFLYTEPVMVEAVELGFASLLDKATAVAEGDEAWTPASTLIPPQLRKYLDQFDRLNPLQSMAVPVVLSTTGHVMVVAPTSSGKTLIGEVAALRSIVSDGKPAVWLLPARALAAEVAEIARRWNAHGIRTIELTGETNMSSDAVKQAQLWVATTEKFEALYRRASLKDVVGRIGCLIIDEVHLVGDSTRGATLESLIARLRVAEGRTRIVALSATVSNADELAAWFHADLVRSTWRPTVLTTQLVPYDVPAHGKREQYEAAKDDVVVPLLRSLVGGNLGSDSAAEDSGSAVSSAVVFCGSKAGVLRTAARAAGVPFRNVDLETVVEACFRHGVGIHFRDAPRAGRALDEFRARRLRVLVATSGLSTGVNTPAKFVIIRDLELGMSPLEVSQAQQMFGRAGRAGQEPEGFGFMLVPRADEAAWKVKLSDGYAANSRITTQLGDAILAELLLGSVVDRSSARSWFEQTLAFAQNRAAADIDEVIDNLLQRGFATEIDGQLTPTEIGMLTSRLMIDVESAGELLRTLAALPLPASADEAEELVVQAVATAATSLRERPVNERTYTDYVDQLLTDWSPRVVARAGKWFGARVCMAAAQLVLRAPARVRESPPVGVSMTEFRRAADDMPRYLAWVAALGYVDASTWAPAVAGDLARRLTWSHLAPHPERGAGRLLWMLERMLEPQHHRDRMQDLWRRARAAGFTSPDGIKARPRDVDVTAEGFMEIVGSRAEFRIEPLIDLELTYRTPNTQARVTALSNTGTSRAIASTRPAHGPIDLVLPPRSFGRVAADVFLYTRDGDFSYASLATDIPATASVTPLEEATGLIDDLPEVHAVLSHAHGVRRLFQGERKRLRDSIRPLIGPDPRLTALARALSEHYSEPDAAVVAMRNNLRALLRNSSRTDLRSPHAVLRAREASEAEVQVTMAALLASLQMASGIATAEGHPLAVVQLNDVWALAGPLHAQPGRIEPLLPAVLPRQIETVSMPAAPSGGVAAPRCEWMAEFAPRAPGPDAAYGLTAVP